MAFILITIHEIRVMFIFTRFIINMAKCPLQLYTLLFLRFDLCVLN